MPTIAELLTSTQGKLDATVARIVTLKQQLADTTQQLTQAEQRHALLLQRLDALDVLSREAP
jgi:hypothetical protein